MDIRTGNGFDVHAFEAGDHVTLCGVRIDFDQGLKGHSDADVGMHSLTDAIYGALAEGDIGQHFPPSDPQWKGTESKIFLRHAVELAASKGMTISHLDCTLICEKPKIGPHVHAMRERLAEITGVPKDRISVKATTSEKLGFTGRGEGIAAQATATLVTSTATAADAFRLDHIVATLAYVGHLRPAPGTWGSLVALPYAWAVHWLGGFPLLLFATVLAFMAGWWATARMTAGSGNHDPSEIVVDELVGQWIALLPISYAASTVGVSILALWPGWIAAFALFRLFDITKPLFVGWADRRGDALGVMLDDVFAGVIAAVGVMVLAGLAHGFL